MSAAHAYPIVVGVGANTANDNAIHRPATILGFDAARDKSTHIDATGTLVQVYDATANKRTDYIPGPVGALARIERDSAGAETVTYLHTDHQGTARAGTGSDGAVKWEDFHTPFGDSLIAPAANDNQADYTGHIRDSGSGLTYMQARYYDPVIGRFLSVDAANMMNMDMNPGYFNRYAYTLNNPTNLTDAYGQCAGPLIIPCAIGAKEAVVGIVAVVTLAVTVNEMTETFDELVVSPTTVGPGSSPNNTFESRSNPPGPLSDPTPDAGGQVTGDAEGRPHSIPGADGGYTTHGDTTEGPAGIKQYRPGAKQPDGSRAPGVKEWGTHTNPETGETFQGGASKRPPEPEEIPK